MSAKPMLDLDDSGLVLHGHDPVAIVTEGRSVPGSAENETTWGGGKWRFVSRANLDKFRASPEKFAPQYGGFCAFAASFGGRAPSDPNTWKVVDGRLFLFAAKVPRVLWRMVPGRIPAADAHWKTDQTGR